MGYTHYWHRKKTFNTAKFAAAAIDINKLITSTDVKVQWEMDDKRSPELTDKLVRFNGIGKEGHETFYVPRDLEPDEWSKPEKGKYFTFCKTAQKPYDLLVAASLVVLKHHLGKDIDVSSDGDKADWEAPVSLVQSTLGYGSNFKLDQD